MKTDAPLTEVDVHLKQLDLDDLDQVGRDAIAHVFTGFADDIGRQEQESRFSRLVADIAPGTRQWFDPSTPRRFAGDRTLPRGRYHTLAKDESGDDDGTLVNELRAYYDARSGGAVQVFDTTNARDRQALEPSLAVDDRSLVLVLLPYAGRPHSLVEGIADGAVPVAVHLPLRLERRRLTDVLDLREPTVAEWFTRAASRLEFDVRGVQIAAFPLKPPLDHFCDLLPEMLSQELGGGGLSKVAGVWLRREGIGGLIFPSARSDCSVTVERSRMSASAGWNFVDYRGAEPPEMASQIDFAAEWPEVVQVPIAEADGEPIRFHDVDIECVRRGSQRGSWRVTGLKRRRDAYWRLGQVLALIEARTAALSEESVRLLEGWLVSRESAEEMGRTSYLVFGALMGLREARSQVAGYATAVRQQGHASLADAIAEMLALDQ